MPSQEPHQPGQARRQDRQATLPGVAGGKAPLFVQPRASLAWQGILLVEECRQHICRIEAATHHDDHRLHNEPIGICLRPARSRLISSGGQGNRSTSKSKLTSKLCGACACACHCRPPQHPSCPRCILALTSASAPEGRRFESSAEIYWAV
jgi:hypothetical protein